MRQLIIDTATEALSVALFHDGELISHHHEITGRGHAEKLLPVISGMDDGGRANEIIVNNGPGSFTGVRVGLAAARALAYAWGATLRAYSSLSLVATMARGQRSGDTAGAITVTMNGGHGEIFWQIFNDELFPLSEVASTPIAALATELSAETYYGTGAQSLTSAQELASTQGRGNACPLYPDARAFPFLPAHLIHTDITPLYGRSADAIPLSQRKK